MRIRIPRRFLLLGVLLCSLAFVTSYSSPTFAKPIPWNPDDGPAPAGDGDGPVVKGGTSSPKQGAATFTTQRNQSTRVTTTVSSSWRTYLTVLRLGHGWRWLW